VIIDVPRGLTARVETVQEDTDSSSLQLGLTAPDGTTATTESVQTELYRGSHTYSHKYGTGATDVTVRVWQGAGNIEIRQPLTSSQNEGTNQ